MKAGLKALAALLCAILVAPASVAQIWIDEDGAAYTDISTVGKYIQLTNTETFYYFDEMFQAAIAGETFRLCYGDKLATGMASDCIEGLHPNVRTQSKGRIRHIKFDLTSHPYTLWALDKLLTDGETLSISIDNGVKYYTTTMHRDYRRKE